MVLELPYENQKFYEIEMCGLKRKLPLRKVSEDTYIASNHALVLGCDIEFTRKVGKKLAEKIRESGTDPQALLSAEAKSLPLVYEVGKNLDHIEIAIARKSKKTYMEEPIGITVKSITTDKEQKLVLDKITQDKIKGKKVCLIDDVVSSGKTMDSLEKLTHLFKGKVVCRAAIWLEGKEYSKELIHLGELPLFKKK
ncbi:hypothetical protein AKJ49_00540 [candidate division MSBL1 archaeon SCGC-AAA382A03]|uniref:Phosphoribosyltransferase domain-containing protein n=1 Tax=candidate division MSBL1 archaeon SCGC-AAA382A03 TaxID=1698278 RepID=A0A133VGL3_9EURY|nr:hypothetical protein AKJ49_00540 [candidate division MSBL1 archaeon SCGC-AAA382A03]